MARPAPPTITDWAVTAVSPILIMLMVGSLVFFLVEVLYQGRYSDRLLWTLFFFVIGTVLIARIMILHGANRALLYIAGLAAATFLALQAFVDYPNLTLRSFSALVNAGLMAVIWWSANKLTWDCTHIDEDRKNAGRGVLDAAIAADEDELEPPTERRRKRPVPGFLGWVQRWHAHQKAQEKKPHTPGVWVLYFSLAAMPIFGLGQSLIPPGDTERRRVVFQQMVVYVGSGLGLLATTTLLGLRKYLRDRGASIPVKMTAGWLGLAAVVTIVFLAAAAVLPRPYSETPLVKLPDFAKSKERKASKSSQVRDRSTGEGDGGRSGQTKHDDKAAEMKEGNSGSSTREDNDAEPGRSDGKSETRRDAETKADDKRGAGRSEKKSEGESHPEHGEQRESQSTESPAAETPKIGGILEKVGSILKWLAWVVIALLVLGAIVIFLLRYLAPFTAWAKNLLDWLSSLLGRRGQGKVDSMAVMERGPTEQRPPPFASFTDPFDDQRRWPPEKLVTYSYRALESWAWERGMPRGEHETPMEFAHRIEQATGLDARTLARLYGQVAYSEVELSRDAHVLVQDFWRSRLLRQPS